jgi:hypothetical protein
MLGYPLLSCHQVLKLLSVSVAWSPLLCWVSLCLGAAWSLLPSIPSPLNSAEEACELSFNPKVATLFGKEIGQSNGDIFTYYLLVIARIKVGL